MKTKIAVALPVVFLAWAAARAQLPADQSWPRVKTAADGARVTLYQPQVDDWTDYVRLSYRIAAEIQEPGSSRTVPAALEMTAETNTDRSNRTVVVYNQRIVKTSFPSADQATAQRLTTVLTGIVPTAAMTMSLDEILAYVVPDQSKGTAAPAGPPSPAAETAAPKAAAVRVITLPPDPPVILYSQTPAVLVLFDGDPRFAPIKETGLQFAINTNWDIFQEEGKTVTYLLNGDAWLEAPAPTGPWEPVEKLPKSFSNIPQEENWARVHENLPGKTVSKKKMPKVFTSVRPAELILLDGKPKLKSIKDTKLSWVSNTESDLFWDKTGKKYYFLVSGRWFRAAELTGPWTLSSNELPGDFTKIPKDHPKASVRASVPGTPEAQEALMLAQAPHKAEIKRSDVTLEVKYTGEPQFQPIEGTTLAYAVNTPNDVIQAGDRYYACYQAVWFVAPSATGPWVVADTIPAEIYSIPSSNPKYNVTYVTVYESTPQTVTTGYTAGYMGAFVAGAVVVYGTGYYYPPYYYYPPGFYYPVYYPYHYSYGMAAAYNPYTGTFARGAVAYGPYGGCGYAAAYNPYTGTYARGAAAWGPYAGRGYAEAYNPYTGAWAQRGAAYGPGGQAGYAARGYNPSTGTGAATYQRSNPYQSWGQSAVTKGDDWARTAHYSDSRGTVAGFETSEGAKGIGASTDNGRTAIAKDSDNNLYAAHDGNVYKNDGDSWQKYENGDWQSVDKPQPPAEAQAKAQDRAQQAGAAGGTAQATTAEARTQAQTRTQQASQQGGTGAGTARPTNSGAQAQTQAGAQARSQQTGTARAGSAQSTGAGQARSSSYSNWSQNYNQLQRDSQARSSSSQRKQSYNSWNSGRSQASRGQAGRGRPTGRRR